MGRFDKGVSKYTVCNLDINVYFPENEVMCRWCPFLTHYDSIERDKCSLTNEILFTKEFTGRKCPLKIINDVDVEDAVNETNV